MSTCCHSMRHFFFSCNLRIPKIRFFERMNGHFGVGPTGDSFGKLARVDNHGTMDFFCEMSETRGEDKDIGSHIHLPMTRLSQIELRNRVVGGGKLWSERSLLKDMCGKAGNTVKAGASGTGDLIRRKSE